MNIKLVQIDGKLPNLALMRLSSYYKENKVFIQLFWLDTLIINITNHEFVPIHRVMNDNEKNNLFIEDEVDDFEFNQDVEFENEIKSPGWLRYQKKIKH